MKFNINQLANIYNFLQLLPMLRFLPLFCSTILSLMLVACSTTATLTPAQRSRIHRIGVTTGLVDKEVTAACLGITIFGNSHSVFSSSRLGLPEAVDNAILGDLRGFKVVPLSGAESQNLRAKIESIPDHGIFNMEEQKTSAGKFASEAARGKNLDAILVVLPGSIFLHDNMPIGHGYMITKYVGRIPQAKASLRLLLCDATTGQMLAQTSGDSIKEINNPGSWESVMSGENPEVGQALRECSEKAASNGVSQLGLW